MSSPDNIVGDPGAWVIPCPFYNPPQLGAPMRFRLLALLLCCVPPLAAQDKPKTEPKKELTYDRKEDVVYGRKHALALTMDVFTPKGEKNGAGVIFCVS